jgi:hypothetical protein
MTLHPSPFTGVNSRALAADVRTNRFLVVEKTGASAGMVRESDPRS